MVGRVFATDWNGHHYFPRATPDRKRVFCHDGLHDAGQANLVPNVTLSSGFGGVGKGTVSVMYTLKGGVAAAERLYKLRLLHASELGFIVSDNRRGGNRFT